MAHQVKKNVGITHLEQGCEFRLWAPFAKAVAVKGVATNWQEIQLTSENDGYWSTVVSSAQPGQSYKYIITSQQDWRLEKNDPYARQITESDEGVCIIPDIDFDWEDTIFIPPPKEKQIIYELHIGTFHRPDASTTGTFATAIEQLDYIENLGINMIELMPITSMAVGSGWGYSPNHIFSVEESYGGRRGMLEFVRECHKRNIGVILDVVYNHFSPESDLWQFDGWSENGRGGIYFYNDERGDTPWGGRPDYGRAEVRQFILDNIAMWLEEYRVDGLRIDSTIYMRSTKGVDGDSSHEISDAWYLLKDITDLAHTINPDVILIAEDSSSEPKITRAIDDDGLGFDSQWGHGFAHALRSSLGLGGYVELYDLNTEIQHLYNGDAFQKVIFSDSHDTAANGQVRLNEAVSPGNATDTRARQQTIVANAVMLSAPGIPMLLQGEEFMEQGSFSEWKMLDWEKSQEFAGVVLAHQHLISLRLDKYGNTSGLSGNSVAVFHQDSNNQVLGYHRWGQGGGIDDVLVIVNFGWMQLDNYQITFPLPGVWHVRFNSSWSGYSQDFPETKIEYVEIYEDQQATITMSPYSVLILSQD